MAALQAKTFLSSSPIGGHHRFSATLNPSSNLRVKNSYVPNFANKVAVNKLILGQENSTITNRSVANSLTVDNNDELIAELLAIAETAADRAEMHAIIGVQRNNWNHLLTNSINSITLIATLMAGISSMSPNLLPFKLASVLFFSAATAMMMIVNKVQPSQLAEEQRKATQLWKQLEKSIRNSITLRAPTHNCVKDAMNKVLALEKAYPLPLLPGMLEKFPENVEPAHWWPKLKPQQNKVQLRKNRIGVKTNGWSTDMEEEMRGILRVIKLKDENEYITVGKVVLSINKAFAISGPIFAGLAAVGSAFIGTPGLGSAPVMAAVLGGSFAATVNTLEHAGQVGMVFELLRNCAGFYRQIEEEIEVNLGEEEVERRENGELFEMKMALQLGRSVSELKEFAAYADSCSCKDEEITEFAGKIF